MVDIETLSEMLSKDDNYLLKLVARRADNLCNTRFF